MSVPNSNGVVPEQTNGLPGQPHVRHIPIFVEGRDEPILNQTTTEATTTNPAGSGNNSHANNMPQQQQRHQQPQHQRTQAAGTSPSQFGGPNSIFSRVKNFPVRPGFDNEFFQGHSQRANSPARNTVPVNVPSQPTMSGPAAAATPPPPSNTGAAADQSIGKIQSIQRDVLALMDQVEQFTGTSKRDKQYMYLDEMLTQNLLKLDTIDTEGKENIKQARREAIKCINICIAALERKTEAAAVAASGRPQ